MRSPYSTDVCAESTSYFIHSLRAASSYYIIWDRDISFRRDFRSDRQGNTCRVFNLIAFEVHSTFMLRRRRHVLHSGVVGGKIDTIRLDAKHRFRMNHSIDWTPSLFSGSSKENDSQSVRDGADFGLVPLAMALVPDNPVAAEDKRRKAIKLTGASWRMHYY